MARHDDRTQVADCPFCGFPVLLPAQGTWHCPSCEAEGHRRQPQRATRTGWSTPSTRDR